MSTTPGNEPGSAPRTPGASFESIDDGGRSEAQIAATVGVGRYSKHLLLCVAGTCAAEGDGLATWGFLKNRLKELEAQGRIKPQSVYRTRTGCLRICRGGPILVVYPDGTWYRDVTPQVCDRILQEHVIGGRVLESHAFAHNPIGASSPSCET